MEKDFETIRSYLVDELKRDLIGERFVDEELSDRPTVHYIAGILFPRNTSVDPDEDNDAGEGIGEDDDIDPGTLMARAINPSSIGMTFMVPAGVTLKIGVKAARYSPYQKEIKIPAKKVSHEITEENLGDGNGNLEEFRTIKQHYWQRKPVLYDGFQLIVNKTEVGNTDIIDGLQLFWRIRKRQQHLVVTLTLINIFSVPDGKVADEYCFFQPSINVQSTVDEKAVFIALTGKDLNIFDPDRKLNNLLYRHSPEFGIGHGCAVTWTTGGDGNRAKKIETSVMPSFEILQVSHDFKEPFQAQEMFFLSQAKLDSLILGLLDFLKGYERWIDEERNELLKLPKNYLDIGELNLSNCQNAADRIREGISLLETNTLVFKAFQLANEAMLIQRVRSIWTKDGKINKDPELSNSHRWRPFQLAFILMCLPSIANPEHPDRSIVDLLWFPTGGGKTEAYLGLTAFIIFFRRMRSQGEEIGAGVTVLMRYTLRLLTLQQFQRAASLIVACESLRRKEQETLGKYPISLGLWVGGAATPNSLKQAQQKLSDLLDDEQVYEGNPYQIFKCPWCGEKLTPRHYSIEGGSMTIKCPGEKCEYHSGLPLYLVDDDIYKVKPTLLLGTVDKFARLPWMDVSGSLFGKLDNKNLPPELIIQDELHLISGPLGTLVGLYETAIDALCIHNDYPPKIIASTATIRRAQEQTEALFNRLLAQFPPPGLDSRNSYFAQQVPKEEAPGRMYIGVYAPGKSNKTTLLRVYASLLQKIFEHSAPEKYRDPYWTLVGYFNSLRELGGAVRLVDDDVRERMRVLSKREEGKKGQRFLNVVRELNSRIRSDEIPEILDLMDYTMTDSAAIDVLLSTNMISVGVDIDRLGLMVVNGQPKMSAEYIQATSRVGRKFPGLVITVYNWTRPRDRSHYERFVGYHSAVYSHVEPTSVTPFSGPARDRGLHGVFVTLIRHLSNEMNQEESAGNFRYDKAVVERARDIILQRVESVDPTELDETRVQLERITKRWEELTEIGNLTYTQPFKDEGNAFLLVSAEKARQVDTLSFPTLNSLRDVEGESGLFIKKRLGRK